MTYIMTADGPKRIEHIKVGDFILTASDMEFEAGKFSLLTKRVSSLIHMSELHGTRNINGILSTYDQEWATIDSKFIKTRELTDSSLIISIDLLTGAALSVYAIINPGLPVTKTHAIRIEDTHTYLLAPNMFGPWYLVHD